jgi:hypothetical protein
MQNAVKSMKKKKQNKKTRGFYAIVLCVYRKIISPKNLTECLFTDKLIEHRNDRTPFDRIPFDPKFIWPNAVWPKVHFTELTFHRTRFDRKIIWPKKYQETEFIFDKKCHLTEKNHLTERSFDKKLFSKNGHLTESSFYRKLFFEKKCQFNKKSFDRKSFLKAGHSNNFSYAKDGMCAQLLCRRQAPCKKNFDSILVIIFISNRVENWFA